MLRGISVRPFDPLILVTYLSHDDEQAVSCAQRFVIEVAAGVSVGRDVHVYLEFSIAYEAESIAQVGLTVADRLHLGTHQFDSCF